MKEIDISNLVDKNNNLNENIPENIIITGKIDEIIISYKYDELDLSKVDCIALVYFNQKGYSIKNHILPNSLEELHCSYNKLASLPNLPNSLKELHCPRNKLASLPDLPNSLKEVYLGHNKLTSLPDLPNSLKELYLGHNKLTSIPKLPNLLQGLYCSGNQLTSLPNLPNSLKKLYCDHNQLISLPDFTHINHRLELSFIQDEPINYIPYNKNIKLYNEEDNRINIEGYPHNPITNQEELDKYMDYIKNYKMNRIKSARK